MTVEYFFPLIDFTCLLLPRFRKTRKSILTARLLVLDGMYILIPLRQRTTLALVYFNKEGAAHLFRGLSQGSLMGMGMGYVEVIDVRGSVTVVGH